ncbi:hypothetical protein C4K13_4406 [Pseudomonas chlororaphis subsp. aureofaciens]|nr:hypothetical protein C4K13_4406 [Pseudomonas chlororaphis subsp. aureofaciens]
MREFYQDEKLAPDIERLMFIYIHGSEFLFSIWREDYPYF